MDGLFTGTVAGPFCFACLAQVLLDCSVSVRALHILCSWLALPYTQSTPLLLYKLRGHHACQKGISLKSQSLESVQHITQVQGGAQVYHSHYQHTSLTRCCLQSLFLFFSFFACSFFPEPSQNMLVTLFPWYRHYGLDVPQYTSPCMRKAEGRKYPALSDSRKLQKWPKRDLCSQEEEKKKKLYFWALFTLFSLAIFCNLL